LIHYQKRELQDICKDLNYRLEENKTLNVNLQILLQDSQKRIKKLEDELINLSQNSMLPPLSSENRSKIEPEYKIDRFTITINKLQEEIKTKQKTIEEQEKELQATRSSFLPKTQLGQDLENLRRELFYSTAFSVKFNLALNGVRSFKDLAALFEASLKEKIQPLDYSVWIRRNLIE